MSRLAKFMLALALLAGLYVVAKVAEVPKPTEEAIEALGWDLEPDDAMPIEPEVERMGLSAEWEAYLMAARPLPATTTPATLPATTTTTASPATPAVELAPPVVIEAADGSVWDRLAQCESGGNWSINTGNGFYGGLQFALASWRGVGGEGYPHEASREEQIIRAEKLLAIQGWGAWPGCARRLGLR